MPILRMGLEVLDDDSSQLSDGSTRWATRMEAVQVPKTRVSRRIEDGREEGLDHRVIGIGQHSVHDTHDVTKTG